MMILVDPNNGIPVYRQLMDQIKFFVSSGVLKPGDPLPSTRSLSSQLGVNPMTISKAYSFLEREQVLERRPGRPLVVKNVDPKELETRKMEQLNESLKHPVRVVKQLNIDIKQAAQAFEDLLKPSGEPHDRN